MTIERATARTEERAEGRVTTIRIATESKLPPERILEIGHDFSARRAEVFDAVSMERMKIHAVGETSADVTEGTRAGPFGVNWERCDYDWSQPGVVTATVTDSNVYAVPGSRWELRATPRDGGSEVEMVWIRTFRRSARGRFFGTAYRRLGRRLFARYVQDIVARTESAASTSRPP
jgi:hypothetical protein